MVNNTDIYIKTRAAKILRAQGDNNLPGLTFFGTQMPRPGNQPSQVFPGGQSELSLQSFDLFGSSLQVPEYSHGRFEGEQNFPSGQSESSLHFLGVFGSIMRKFFP